MVKNKKIRLSFCAIFRKIPILQTMFVIFFEEISLFFAFTIIFIYILSKSFDSIN